MDIQPENSIRHDWTIEEALSIFELPFNDLIFKAQTVHRSFFDQNRIQICILLSIKTGACPEDCKYCPQSGHYNTGLDKQKLLKVKDTLLKAKQAKKAGATRFCMGAAWKNPPKKDFPYILEMVKGIKELGLETCMTLGSITFDQSQQLKEAGLDYYNHNLDTSPEFYDSIITTRTYNERLKTLEHIRNAGINVCSGGIMGMGESRRDRAGLLVQLANLPKHPESVPINMLVKVQGTPLENVDDLDPFEFIRCIAVARIMMPESYVRLSAGRSEMNEQTQSLAYFAGANSVFYGDKLLTTNNPGINEDDLLFEKLGMIPESKGVEDKDRYQEHELHDQILAKQDEILFVDATKNHTKNMETVV